MKIRNVFCFAMLAILFLGPVACTSQKFEKMDKTISDDGDQYNAYVAERVNPWGNDATTVFITHKQKSVMTASQISAPPPPQSALCVPAPAISTAPAAAITVAPAPCPQQQQAQVPTSAYYTVGRPMQVFQLPPQTSGNAQPTAPVQQYVQPAPAPTITYVPATQTYVQPAPQQQQQTIVFVQAPTEIISVNNVGTAGIMKSVAPALIQGGAYAGGQYLRRPNRVNVNGGSDINVSNGGAGGSSSSSSSAASASAAASASP